jgi:hypothetical protein
MGGTSSVTSNQKRIRSNVPSNDRPRSTPAPPTNDNARSIHSNSNTLPQTGRSTTNQKTVAVSAVVRTNSHGNGNGNGNGATNESYNSGSGLSSHSNIDTDAPAHSHLSSDGHSGIRSGNNSGIGNGNNSGVSTGDSHLSSSSSLSNDSFQSNNSGLSSGGSSSGATSSGGSGNTNGPISGPDGTRRRTPRHFVFPPVDPAAKAAASAIVERFASMDALISHHSNATNLPSLLDCEVEGTGVVPFFSASYYALQCDPTLMLDTPGVALSRPLKLALVNDRRRMLASLDELWEVYTAHWLKAYSAVHVGTRAAPIVLGYLQVQQKTRTQTSSSSSRQQSNNSQSHSRSSGTSTSGNSREISSASRSMSPSTSSNIAVMSATGTALSMMVATNRTSHRSTSVMANVTSTTINNKGNSGHVSTIGATTSGPPGLRISVPDDDSDSIIGSNNNSEVGGTSAAPAVTIIRVEDSPKFKLQPINIRKLNNRL